MKRARGLAFYAAVFGVPLGAFCALLAPGTLCAGESGRIVLVYPFENNGPAEFSYLSAAFTEAVIADLYRVRGVQVIATEDRQKARRELAFAQTGQAASMLELGRLLGANLIFTGSYTVAGEQVRVIARLVSVRTGRTEYSGKIDGTLDKLFDLQDRIVVALLSESEKIKLPPPRPAPAAAPAVGDLASPTISPENEINTVSTKPPRRPPGPGSPQAHGHNPPVRPARPDAVAYRWYAKGLEVQYTAPGLAVEYFDRALEIQPAYVDALVQAGFTLGNELRLYDQAMEYLDRAEAAFPPRARRSVEYARYLRLCGAVYHGRREFRRGLDYSLRAQGLMEDLDLGATADYAYVLNNIGNAYYREGVLGRAIHFFARSREIQEAAGLGRTYKYAILMNNLGAVHNARGSAREALFFFRRAHSILDATGLLGSTFGAMVLENMGRLYRDHGQEHEALAYFRDARRIRSKLKGAGSSER